MAQQQAIYSRSRLDLATTDADIRKNREKLNRLLGLWGADTDWEISGDLPKVPGSDLPVKGLERLAISQRLDLQADYLQVTSLAKALGLTKDFRFLGALDFGVDSERGSDSQTITGPTFGIELPIFNQGQARIARTEAALRQAQKKFEALAVDVRSVFPCCSGLFICAHGTISKLLSELDVNTRWTKFEEFPRFMEDVKEACREDRKYLLWKSQNW